MSERDGPFFLGAFVCEHAAASEHGVWTIEGLRTEFRVRNDLIQVDRGIYALFVGGMADRPFTVTVSQQHGKDDAHSRSFAAFAGGTGVIVPVYARFAAPNNFEGTSWVEVRLNGERVSRFPVSITRFVEGDRSDS